MSLSADYWIYPDGEAEEMREHEHAAIALREMLRLEDDEKIPLRDLWRVLTPDEIREAKRRGVSQAIIEFLMREVHDPRYFVICAWGWIRVARSKFNVCRLDNETLEFIRESSYWDTQPNLDDQDMVDIEELGVRNSKLISITVGKLRNPNTTAESLKAVSEGVAQWRNPENKKAPEEYLKNYLRREKVFRKLELNPETCLPSDHQDPGDIAFGVTRNGVYLDATQVPGFENTGSISHGVLLFSAGLSSSPDDPRPSDDYIIRGIVKKKLDRVIFWETSRELVARSKWVKIAVQKLLDHKLIKQETEIYGANENSPLAKSYEIIQDW